MGVFGIITYLGVQREQATADLVDHTHSVIDENRALLAQLVDAETGERGFIITGDSAYLDPYHGAAAAVTQHVRRLRQLTRDNPAQQVRLDSVQPLIGRRLAALELNILIRRRSGLASARTSIIQGAGGKAMMDSVRAMLAGVEGEELQLLAARDAERARHERLVAWIIVVGTLIATGVAMFIDMVLSRAAVTQARLARQLESRAGELEAANRQLEDQAVEMEQLNEELHSSNDELEQRTAEAEEANRIKSRFVAGVSHDFRTPLNAIIGYVDLLELGIRGPITSEQMEDLRRIKRSSNHLLSLIANVLEFAKIEAGRVEVRLEEIRVCDVLAAVEPVVAPQMKAKQLAFRRGDCDPTVLIRADREKLDRILLNLLGNAITYTAPGGRIQVNCAEESASVRLEVSDTGRGIPSDQLEAVFHPFVQVGRERSEKGFGLGLSISRELARAMDGDLTVTSVVGDGSTFSVRLPRGVRHENPSG